MMTIVPPAEGGEKPRILVIDDEQRIRDACRMVLADQGFDVAVAPDGMTGLTMIEAAHFDIILLDLMMPLLSGFEVLARVRDLDPDAVVVVITGYATLEHSIEAMKNGAFDFIPKPFTPDQLRAVVAKSLKYTRALQDIVRAKSRLRLMVNRLTDGVMTTDTAKRIVQVNPAFLYMIGYRGDSVIGRTADETLVGPQLVRLLDQALAMEPHTYAELVEELVTGGADGSDERIISARCTPFRGRTSSNLGTITVLHDITAIKRMDRMKSDFVSMVSHEIRSPVNSLLMQLKIILDGLAGEVTDKQREILERASGKIMNLNNLVTELLDLSRIESGLISHEKEEIGVADLLAEQHAFHAPYAAGSKQTIRVETEDDLPTIFANRRNIEEALANLVTNAIKYSPEGGSIVLGAAAAGGYVHLSVSDTGFGIPEEDLDKIFTRFYRVRDDNTRDIHGTGLGLAIVKGIVDAHHGSIGVRSTPGEGTVFTLRLPVSGA